MTDPRAGFVQVSTVTMEPGNDGDALGAAVTLSLCGHWDHEPPCPLSPHQTTAERAGDQFVVRTVFAVEADLEGEVRARIEQALAQGWLTGPTGETTRWSLRASAAGEPTAAERILARRLGGQSGP